MSKDLRQQPSEDVETAANSVYEVGVLVDTATSWGRSIIAGVGTYSLKRGGWVLRFEQAGATQARSLPRGWHGHGVVARVTDERQLEDLQALKVPVVNISAALPGKHFPTVLINSQRIAQLAADHLINRGITHFGYLGVKNRAYSRERWQFFRDAVSDAAASVTCHDLPFEVRTESQVWQRRTGLIEWLMQAPRPFGLAAWTDDLARLAIEACQIARLRVPEDVAIIGNDNDELICNLTAPPMSSIELGVDRVGYKAAELLEEAMGNRNWRQQTPELHLIEPIGVIDRQSTNLLSIDDTEVATALRYIWEHFHRPIQVSDTLERLTISRRSLERRFKAVVGRTPAAEIRRVRLDHARRLLLETDLPIASVSRQSGFEYPEHFTSAFRQRFDMPPQRFREKTRLARAPGIS